MSRFSLIGLSLCLGFLALANNAAGSQTVETTDWTSGFNDSDSDGDGVNDDLDNCTDVPNPGQEDVNVDLTGDICDADVAGPVAPIAPGLVGYEGLVIEASGAFAVLTPVGTPVVGPIAYDVAAVDGGFVGPNDIVSINFNIGGFCFSTQSPGQCPLGGTIAPLIITNSVAVTFENGLPTGAVLEARVFSPTFGLALPVIIDHDAGTVLLSATPLGIARGTFVPGAPQDCLVDFLDLQAVRQAFFSTPDSSAWNPEVDFDGNGVIGFPDLGVIKSQFLGPPGRSARGCNSRN